MELPEKGETVMEGSLDDAPLKIRFWLTLVRLDLEEWRRYETS